MTDTAPIRSEERFDEARVAAALEEMLPAKGPWSFEQFPGGKANLTYLARAGDGTEYVLRRPPLGPVAPGSHDMHREFTVLSRLGDRFPKAPVAHAFCGDETVMGAPFFVMERRHGHVVREAWPESLAGLRETVGTNLVDTLVELHVVDYEAAGLGELGKPAGFAERQIAGWTDRWNRARSIEVPEMDRLAATLGGSIPEPIPATLLHNDFKLDNTMLDDDGSVVGVFDWDMATLGDPRFDVGTMLAYWVGPDDAVFPLLRSASLSDIMSRDQARRRYLDRRPHLAERLAWFEAFARFRIAVIVQQIAIRYLRGQTSDSRFAGLDAMVPPMAVEALDLPEVAP